MRYLTLLFVFILVVERVRESEKEGDALEAGVLILGAIVATLTVVQTLLKSGPMLGGYEPGAHWQARRVVSTFINENHQAAFFNLLTFVAFDSAFRAFGYRKRALYGFLGWGFAGLSLASGSRAGWWALLVGGIVYFVVQNKASFMRKHPRHFWGLLLGTLVGSAGLITLADSLLELGWIEGPDGKWNSKLQGILVAAQSIPAFWFTGMGADAFGEGAGLMNEGLPNLYLTHVENSPLQFLMNFGLLPGAALLWGWIRVGKRVCWAGVKDLEHPGIVIGILVVVLQNMADFFSFHFGSRHTRGCPVGMPRREGCCDQFRSSKSRNSAQRNSRSGFGRNCNAGCGQRPVLELGREFMGSGNDSATFRSGLRGCHEIG